MVGGNEQGMAGMAERWQRGACCQWQAWGMPRTGMVSTKGYMKRQTEASQRGEVSSVRWLVECVEARGRNKEVTPEQKAGGERFSVGGEMVICSVSLCAAASGRRPAMPSGRRAQVR